MIIKRGKYNRSDGALLHNMLNKFNIIEKKMRPHFLIQTPGYECKGVT